MVEQNRTRHSIAKSVALWVAVEFDGWSGWFCFVLGGLRVYIWGYVLSWKLSKASYFELKNIVVAFIQG